MPESRWLLKATVDWLLGKAGDTVSWALLGEVVGHLVGLFVPDILVSDGTIGHIVGTLFAALYGLRLFTRFKTHRARNLSDCLADAEQLLGARTIDEEEYKMIRVDCFTRFSTARRQIDEEILYKRRSKTSEMLGGHE